MLLSAYRKSEVIHGWCQILPPSWVIKQATKVTGTHESMVDSLYTSLKPPKKVELILSDEIQRLSELNHSKEQQGVNFFYS